MTASLSQLIVQILVFTALFYRNDAEHPLFEMARQMETLASSIFAQTEPYDSTENTLSTENSIYSGDTSTNKAIVTDSSSTETWRTVGIEDLNSAATTDKTTFNASQSSFHNSSKSVSNFFMTDIDKEASSYASNDSNADAYNELNSDEAPADILDVFSILDDNSNPNFNYFPPNSSAFLQNLGVQHTGDLLDFIHANGNTNQNANGDTDLSAGPNSDDVGDDSSTSDNGMHNFNGIAEPGDSSNQYINSDARSEVLDASVINGDGFQRPNADDNRPPIDGYNLIPNPHVSNSWSDKTEQDAAVSSNHGKTSPVHVSLPGSLDQDTPSMLHGFRNAPGRLFQEGEIPRTPPYRPRGHGGEHHVPPFRLPHAYPIGEYSLPSPANGFRSNGPRLAKTSANLDDPVMSVPGRNGTSPWSTGSNHTSQRASKGHGTVTTVNREPFARNGQKEAKNYGGRRKRPRGRGRATHDHHKGTFEERKDVYNSPFATARHGQLL